MVSLLMNDLVRLQRFLKRYSLTRLSQATGISRLTLGRFRDGKSSPTLDNIGKILDVAFADAIAASDARRGIERS